MSTRRRIDDNGKESPLRPRRGGPTTLGILLGFAILLGPSGGGEAGEGVASPAPAFENETEVAPRHKIASNRSDGRRAYPYSGDRASATGGAWWLGGAGLAVIVAVLGGLGYLSKRLHSESDLFPMRVVGRAGLSPKHSVTLLKVGDRLLLIGTGPQGAPALLGEIEPGEMSRVDRDTGSPRGDA